MVMVKKATSSQVSGRSSSTQVNSPSVAIFQWLSYAFWGWTAIATAALVGICTNFALNGYTSNYEAVAYVVAAAFVLLPIAVVCDVLFSRRERDEKDRVGMVIMVIHAVLFALIAVAALASLVFSLVSIVLSDTSDISGPLVSIATSAVLAGFFGKLTFRIMRPMTKTRMRLWLRSFFILVVLAAMVWGIAGPVTQTLVRKDDARAQRAVETAQSFVSAYVSQNNALPGSIEDATNDASGSYLGEAERQVVLGASNDGFISYTPNVRPAETELLAGDVEPQTTYFYELCVTYKYDDKNRAQNVNYFSEPASYSDGVPGSSTEAGENCYEVKAVSYGNGVVRPL